MRVQFDVPEAQAKELKTLMNDIGVPTKRELFNNALSLLEWTVQQLKDGRVIGSIDESKDSYKELVMPFFSEVKAKRERVASAAAASLTSETSLSQPNPKEAAMKD